MALAPLALCPGDVVRQLALSPSEAFEALKRSLQRLNVVAAKFGDASLELVAMVDFVVLRVAIRIYSESEEDSEEGSKGYREGSKGYLDGSEKGYQGSKLSSLSSRLVFRDQVKQDVVRFHRLLQLIMTALENGEEVDSDWEDEDVAAPLPGVPALLDLAASSSKASFEAAQLLAKAADAAARPEIQKAFAKLQMDQVEIPKVGKQLQPLMVPPLLVALKGEEKASAVLRNLITPWPWDTRGYVNA